VARPLDVDVLLGRARRSFAGRCLRDFLDLRGLDRAMVLASQAFTALIPLLILVSAVLPAGNTTVVSDAVIRRFGLSGEAAAAVEAVFAHPDSGSIGAASLLLLVFSGVSLTRRMQLMYVQAWRLPPLRGVRGSLNAMMGLTVLLVELALLYLVRSLVRSLPFDWALQLPLSWAAGALLWTTIPWLLMDRRISWRRLLPGGVLTAVLASVYGVATTVYMPAMMTSYSERYGLFGVTIALVGWLLCICFLLIAATVVAAELDRAPEHWPRRLRTALGIDGGPTAGPLTAGARETGGP
jgi:membrane protein